MFSFYMYDFESWRWSLNCVLYMTWVCSTLTHLLMCCKTTFFILFTALSSCQTVFPDFTPTGYIRENPECLQGKVHCNALYTETTPNQAVLAVPRYSLMNALEASLWTVKVLQILNTQKQHFSSTLHSLPSRTHAQLSWLKLLNASRQQWGESESWGAQMNTATYNFPFVEVDTATLELAQ